MFRVLQIDPETLAIHMNEGAILRHRAYEDIIDLSAHFFEDNPRETVRFLRGLTDTNKQAMLAVFASSMLHELRHYLDLSFTCYGFYRLRSAFEFYNYAASLLVDDQNPKIPIPIMSGADLINQQLLGLGAYQESPFKRFSDLALNRSNVISQDNRKYTLSTGLTFGVGGDAIMEALAYGTQSEWLVHLFNTPACRGKYPYFFSDYAGSKFDVRYRWYGPFAKALSSDYNQSAARLTQNILFASLCGAFARGAKYSSRPESSRFIDDCLPSNRLKQLYAYFKKRGVPDCKDWLGFYEAVDQACCRLWGRSLVDEIEMDISADLELIRLFKTANPQICEEGQHSILAFEDLVEMRLALLRIFKEAPILFINPAGFAADLAALLAPPVIRMHPQGLGSKPTASTIGWVCDRNLRYKLQNKDGTEIEKQENVCYAYWDRRDCDERLKQVRSVNAWSNVFTLGPLYKGFLYGHKYRSMLEADIVFALHDFDREAGAKFVWDSIYRRAQDVGPADDYFHFYDLAEAQCDSCGRMIDRTNSVIVSSATAKQNVRFVEQFQKEHNSTVAYELLVKDWSSWLLCLEEARAWDFVN